MTSTARIIPRSRAPIGTLLITLMVILAGCGGNSNQTSNSTTAEPTTPTETVTLPENTEPPTPNVDPTPPKPEPETPVPSVEPERESEPEIQPQFVHLTGTVITVRDQTAFLIVEQVIEGVFGCDQASILMTDATDITVGAQYDITGQYDLADTNCRLRLVNPALDLRLLAAPIPVMEPELPVSPSIPSDPKGLPFFVSGGISLVEEIPVFLGSGGFGLADNVKGMLTAGLGTGQLELALPSGEPIRTDINITLVEVAALYNVAGNFYVGASGGVLLLSGDFQLPYPVSGSTKFNTMIPIVGVVLGYDLGFVMTTISVGIALGGRS